jgi:hypothetical protein
LSSDLAVVLAMPARYEVPAYRRDALAVGGSRKSREKKISETS